MTKHDHVLYWKETAESNWQAAQGLFLTGQYLECLFFAHLVIEKLSKAHWVQDNADDYPPRTHNVLKLWAATALQPSPAQELTATELNTFQMEGRYQDYQRIASQRATQTFTRSLLDDTEQLRAWLLSKLP